MGEAFGVRLSFLALSVRDAVVEEIAAPRNAKSGRRNSRTPRRCREVLARLDMGEAFGSRWLPVEEKSQPLAMPKAAEGTAALQDAAARFSHASIWAKLSVRDGCLWKRNHSPSQCQK